MRQDFVPRISFNTKFEVAVPDVGRNALLHLACGHVVVKFRATRHCVAYRGEKFTGSFEDFGNRINESLVITRLMPFNWRHNRRHNVLRTTMFRQENFDACAGGLCRLDKNESVFMGQNHGLIMDSTPKAFGVVFGSLLKTGASASWP